jgi:phage tail sheath protein FI
VGALPLIDAATPDLRGLLETSGVLAPDGADPGGASSAFVQLAAPWLRTRAAADLPEGLEPPDGALAGMIAANALGRGTFRSVAGTRLPEITDTEPVAAWGLGPDSPWARLAERVSVIAHEPGGWALQSDVTTFPGPAWRAGGATRMMATLVRAARASGEAELFEANGPALWTRIRRNFEALLTAYWEHGGLGGASPSDAFDVRCDRSTMTQQDLDAGRVRTEITVLPAAAVERITVVLELTAGGETRADVREVG